jgi:type I restriction enzyme S subunit
MQLFWKELGTKLQYGAATNFIKIGNFQNYEVSFPPLPEQQRIVSILDEAFAAIDKAKANAEKNLKNAKELFESYLQGVIENEDCETIKFSDVCVISSKLIDPKKSEFQNLIHIGAGNIESRKGTLIDLKTAKEENLISGKFLFDETMILYSKIRPYLMKVVNCEFKGLCSADIYPLVPIKGRLLKEFLYYLLLTKDFTDYAILGSQRAGMPKVNREHLFAFKLKLPVIKEQQIIVNKLNVLLSETNKLESIYQQKLTDLQELKKSILQKAFNGELNIDY